MVSLIDAGKSNPLIEALESEKDGKIIHLLMDGDPNQRIRFKLETSTSRSFDREYSIFSLLVMWRVPSGTHLECSMKKYSSEEENRTKEILSRISRYSTYFICGGVNLKLEEVTEFKEYCKALQLFLRYTKNGFFIDNENFRAFSRTYKAVSNPFIQMMNDEAERSLPLQADQMAVSAYALMVLTALLPLQDKVQEARRKCIALATKELSLPETVVTHIAEYWNGYVCLKKKK